MAGIFINYRREDSSGWAGGLSRDLRAYLGDDEVFEDIAAIDPGMDFTQAIESKLANVDVLLAVIGPNWLAMTDKKTGKRRLDNPEDLVRREIAIALQRNIRVVPVLVGRAALPSAEDLPEDLQGLLRRNACELSDTRWRYDVQELARRLRPATGFVSSLADRARSLFGRVRPGYAAASIAAIAAIAVLGILWVKGDVGRHRGPLDTVRLAIIDDRLEGARSTYSYLEEQGATLSFIGTTELAKLQPAKPDVVIVGAGTRWTRTDPIALKQIFEGYKVIGMGNSADELFGRLDLQITNVMHSRQGGLMVQDPALLAAPVAINAPDQSVDIFKSQVQGAAIGIYDKGSPDIAGFEGLARWQSFKNHWPIARQGNFLFWGFEGGTGQLSDNGKALFANLIVNHKSRPWAPLSKVTEESEARRKLEQVPPGISTGQLSAQVTKIVRRFSIKKPGPIEATLTWDSSDCALALILNGPGQRGYFARKDGASPLSLQFIVTEEQFAKGDDWSISVTCFRDLGPDPIKFSMKLNFPDTP